MTQYCSGYGKIKAIRYTPGTIATGATLTITAQNTGQPVLTKSSAGTSVTWYYPVSPANKAADGSASTLTERDIWLCQEALQVVIASGGNGGAGSIMLLVDEPVVG